MLDDPLSEPRGKGGQAPDVFRPGAWVPMRHYAHTDEVDFLIVGAGAGAGRLPAGWRRTGSPSSVSTPGRGSGRSRISHPTKRNRRSCIGPTTGSPRAGIRCSLVPTTAARRLAAAPCTSRWCRCDSAPSGSSRAACWAMARTGRSIGARCVVLQRGRTGAENGRADDLSVGPETAALSVSRARTQRRRAGARRRLPGTGHCLDGDTTCHAIGAPWTGASLRLSRLLRHRLLHQRETECAGDVDSACRGGGAEIRDLAMVGRIEVNDAGRVTGVHYHREGSWHFQRARNVVVAGTRSRRLGCC